jgi:Zn-dependent M16 (insulinase) family peptidase
MFKGPLWEAVRGPGYAYHQSMYLNPEKALINLSLDECSNVTKAYESTRKILVIKHVHLFFERKFYNKGFNLKKDHLSNRTEFDENLLESAKNSLIFLLIDDLKSVSNYSAYSMSCIFKGVKIDAIA